MIWGEPDECLTNELKADMESTNSTGFSRNLSSELLLRYEAESSSNESIMIEQNHGQLVRQDNECLEEAALAQEDMSADDEHEYLEKRRNQRDDQDDRRGNPVTDGDGPTAQDWDKFLCEPRLGHDPGTRSAKKEAKRYGVLAFYSRVVA
jgi:hypothetical protein